jgi:uncharacterized protein YbaP (TraB family)
LPTRRARKSCCSISPEVRHAFAASSSFLTELVVNEAVAQRAYEAAQFEDDRVLEALIGADEYARVSASMQARGFPSGLLPRTKAWAVVFNLALSPADTGQAHPVRPQRWRTACSPRRAADARSSLSARPTRTANAAC